MMPTLPVSLPVRPDAAPTPSPEAHADAPRGESSGFARVLREAGSSEARPPAAPDAAAARDPRDPRHAAARERTGPGRTRTGETPAADGSARATARPPTRESAETATAEAATSASAPSEVDSDGVIDGSAATVPVIVTADVQTPRPDDPALSLPSLPPARIALDRVANSEADAAAQDATPDGSPAGRRITGPVAGHTLPGRHPLAAVDGRSDGDNAASAPAGEPHARLVEAAADSARLAALGTAKSATTEPVPAGLSANAAVELTTALSTPPGAVPAGPEGLVPRAAASPAHAVAEARLAAAPGTQAFTHSLGEQVGLWVRDGVQEARLQLHPAELGPVQISIALDGALAQVDFHAAHARTREAIEASLPALASALRESGFTLAGGGVFGQGGGDASSRTPPRTLREAGGQAAHAEAVEAAGIDVPTAAAARGPGWRRGLLDVFA